MQHRAVVRDFALPVPPPATTTNEPTHDDADAGTTEPPANDADASAPPASP
jgi:hypothetical protein